MGVGIAPADGPDLVEHPSTGCREGEHRGPPVVRVGVAFEQAALLQDVDDVGDRAGATRR